MNDHSTHEDSNKKVADEQEITHTDQTKQGVENEELAACKTELQDLKSKILRVTADFQNFQARIAKERTSWMRDAQIELMIGLLPVLDNFDRALTDHQKQEHGEVFTTWLTGFELIAKDLYKFLFEKGVREIDCSTTFDPQYHEAIAHVADPNKSSGEIIEVLQKGYLLNDTVIRPAKVIVAK
ncbi:TPA: nucleotide exchange factor GrpE [Candidatus Dependentiae bacterium]|nr:MAG: Molecular chaperone GrpE [candidate division TM6 bacterium GW2011_GWF2_36_131]KKQ02652.1 MAG: Molecular chaperone GrpE [candidate division TM6 bacterium GW2011_GWE2_36_25]HBR70284.1 nucleotide exchange factor GrpE [Candidatus Dependentiae bacterium]HCU00944.1 nucleotide exchange factor GrpE [Candidatus Dependentiae bacterium]